jgi:HSP20 family protein
MRTLTPINSVLDRMVTLSRAMDEAIDAPANGHGLTAWTPALDASETEQAYVVSVDLPGVSPESVEVHFERNTLTIHGTREIPKSDSERGVIRERVYGSFARSLRFPQHVEGDRISAAFANGVLTVTVPKSEKARPRKVEITTV